MGSVCSSMSSSCLQGQVRFGGGVLLFILGSSLGGVGPVRGLRGGGSGSIFFYINVKAVNLCSYAQFYSSANYAINYHLNKTQRKIVYL